MGQHSQLTECKNIQVELAHIHFKYLIKNDFLDYYHLSRCKFLYTV
jgi:hypothetical protein